MLDIQLHPLAERRISYFHHDKKFLPLITVCLAFCGQVSLELIMSPYELPLGFPIQCITINRYWGPTIYLNIFDVSNQNVHV